MNISDFAGQAGIRDPSDLIGTLLRAGGWTVVEAWCEAVTVEPGQIVMVTHPDAVVTLPSSPSDKDAVLVHNLLSADVLVRDGAGTAVRVVGNRSTAFVYSEGDGAWIVG